MTFHTSKSIIALYINWLILNKLNTDDYVTWAITSSILMIATASDLGIGQHTVTSLIKSKVNSRGIIIAKACTAIIPLFLFAFIFVLLSLSGSKNYVLLMAIFVSLRLFSIPFGSLFNAINKFKIRKIIEFFSYLIAAISISLIVFFLKDVETSLLALNISFLIGSLALVIVSQKYFSIKKINFSLIKTYDVVKVFSGSLPFLINNTTALLTYGGFIWICSFVLSNDIIAKLSVLHTFFLMTLYQLYDVFLRSKQADLIIPKKINSTIILNRFLIIIVPVFLFLFGKIILKIIAPNILFGNTEILLFAIFIVLEFCFLVIQSIVQVDFKYAKGLYYYSAVKIISFVIPFIIFFISNKEINMIFFLSSLNIGSFIGLLISNYYFKSKTRFSLWS